MTTVSPAMRQRIAAVLDRVERDHGVRILFAVESGSRAWGFPSPDSDYDVRFVYARPRDGYLTLAPVRDVIEIPPDAVLDVNGWDLPKALTLLAKGNAVPVEWLTSPILYRADGAALDTLRDLATRIVNRPATWHHYRSLVHTMFTGFINGRPRVKLKKYLYALRPACALVWLRTHPGGTVPMDLPALMAGIDLSPGIRDAVGVLLERKARISELGDDAPWPVLDAFIRDELERPGLPPRCPAEQAAALAEADRVFRHLIRP